MSPTSTCPTPGALDRIDYPNGTYAAFGYDTLDRVNSIEHRQTAGDLLASYVYTLGATGRREGVQEDTTEGLPHESEVTYAYDDLDRLVEEHRTGSPAAYDLVWTYDDVGNRQTETRDSVVRHYSYDERDRLWCESSASNPDCSGATLVDYSWDANGNMNGRGSEVCR